ncbi:MAG: glycosyltransferase [Prevotellaceae bacterium]|jgi:glycosyltransferase involved in cell wall biosynthesis|nr:glycosyltransferase [Prevotellaceae bacterium]
MQNKILISVIMPVYNTGKYMYAAVNSILTQSLRDIELVLVDDGSTDGTSEKSDVYSQKDSRVVVIHQKNAGISNARNAGIDVAKGEYIAFCDHDDMFLPGLLENAYSVACQTESDVVKFSREQIWLKDEKVIREAKYIYVDGVYSEQEIKENFFLLVESRTLTAIWDGIYKRKLLLDNEIHFDEAYKYGGEDVDFTMKLLKHTNKLTVLSTIYYRHYKRIGFSSSTKFDVVRISNTTRFFQTILSTINSLEINIEECRMDFTLLLLRQYLSHMFVLYANPKYQITYMDRIKNLEALYNADFIPAWFYKHKTCTILRKSKKMGLLYFLLKYKMYGCLLLSSLIYLKKEKRI